MEKKDSNSRNFEHILLQKRREKQVEGKGGEGKEREKTYISLALLFPLFAHADMG